MKYYFASIKVNFRTITEVIGHIPILNRLMHICFCYPIAQCNHENYIYGRKTILSDIYCC